MTTDEKREIIRESARILGSAFNDARSGIVSDADVDRIVGRMEKYIEVTEWLKTLKHKYI